MSQVFAAPKIVDVFQLTENAKEKGIGHKIGTISFEDSKRGLLIHTHLQGLPIGPHGFHIHQSPACEGGEKGGHWVPGLAAGDHFDPQHTSKHLGPYVHGGHLGDLPFIVVLNGGKSEETLIAPHLTLAQIENHSLIIHQHGDNYSDKPQPLGGGGLRIACGVIQ